VSQAAAERRTAKRGCSEAMLREAVLAIVSRPEDEVYICRRQDRVAGHSGAVYPAQVGVQP
jgi:tRNA (mo5U34)-methyltransferase